MLGSTVAVIDSKVANGVIPAQAGIQSNNEGVSLTGLTLFGEGGGKDAFFTGKPQVEELGYTFLFRNYRSDMNKWQTADPLGYPDGFNNFAYLNNQVENKIDPLGLWIDKGSTTTIGNPFLHTPGTVIYNGQIPNYTGGGAFLGVNIGTPYYTNTSAQTIVDEMSDDKISDWSGPLTVSNDGTWIVQTRYRTKKTVYEYTATMNINAIALYQMLDNNGNPTSGQIGIPYLHYSRGVDKYWISVDYTETQMRRKRVYFASE